VISIEPPLTPIRSPKRSPNVAVCPSVVSEIETPALHPRQMPPVLLQVIPVAHAAQAAPPVPHWVLLSLA
jgi:hypothetical protein